MELTKLYPQSRKEAISTGSLYYFTGEECKRGHVDVRYTSTFRCKSCSSIMAREYRDGNPEYAERERKAAVKRQAEKYKKDPEYKKYADEQSRKYREKVSKDPEKRAARNKRENERRRSDASYRAKANKLRKAWLENPKNKARMSLRDLLKRAYRLGYVKNESTEKALGYNPIDLMKSMESKFLDGMSWGNHGDWHIDHIKPVSSFPQGTAPSVINALDNLQPLWASDNLKKGAK
ncbi:hypothetical protein VPH209E381_0045 [Vibrio phage 209E38-1]